MSIINALLDALFIGQPIRVGPPAPEPGTDSPENEAVARKQLAVVGVAALALVSAPALYIAYKASSKGKKRKMNEKELMYGQTLENASTQATGVLMTALAAPALSTAAAYILVQKLEDAKFITRGLGNATQGLLTVAAAGPALQGIGAIAGSAFKRGK
jgi:heme/copper-type cytochrome/quinol oxidase subunit 2